MHLRCVENFVFQSKPVRKNRQLFWSLIIRLKSPDRISQSTDRVKVSEVAFPNIKTPCLKFIFLKIKTNVFCKIKLYKLNNFFPGVSLVIKQSKRLRLKIEFFSASFPLQYDF